MQELALNPEFAYLTAPGGAGLTAPRGGQQQRVNLQSGGGGGNRGYPSLASGAGQQQSNKKEERGLGDQISSMGSEAKRRLQMFAMRFDKKPNGGKGTKRENVGLLNGGSNDEDEEEITFSPLNSGGPSGGGGGAAQSNIQYRGIASGGSGRDDDGQGEEVEMGTFINSSNGSGGSSIFEKEKESSSGWGAFGLGEKKKD